MILFLNKYDLFITKIPKSPLEKHFTKYKGKCFEIKLDEGIFLEIACGINGKPNELFKSGNILSLGALKYSFNKDRRFDIN